jgi:multicomponent Na+:H+ antiporter subunit G
VREGIVIALVAIGGLFSLSGAVGILRLPDVYSRIQSSTMIVTMGALPVLIALAVGEGPVSSYGGRALLVAVLLLVVNPAASHALARAAYKTGIAMWPGAVADQVMDAPAVKPGRTGRRAGPGEKGRTAGPGQKGGPGEKGDGAR